MAAVRAGLDLRPEVVRNYRARIARARNESMTAQYSGEDLHGASAKFEVRNADQTAVYDVIINPNQCTCTCTDWNCHRRRCKHIFNTLAVLFVDRDVVLYTESMNFSEAAHVMRYTTSRRGEALLPSLREGLRAARAAAASATYAPRTPHVQIPVADRFHNYLSGLANDDPGMPRRRRRTRRGGVFRRRSHQTIATVANNPLQPQPDYPVEGRPLNEDEHECCICRDSIGNLQLRTHCCYCGHNFHGECVMRWLNQTPTCPLCKQHWPEQRRFQAR